MVDDVDYGAADEELGAMEAKADDDGGAATEDYGPGLNDVNTEQQDYGAGTVTAASSRYAIADDALPEGWVAVYDPLSASTYYYHQETKETTWDRPE